MKENKRSIDKEGKGTIELFPEDNEDLWHLYNIITKGDSVTQLTKRKVKLETSSTGAQELKTLKLTIKVEKVEYDSIVGQIRISGIIQNQNRFVKTGRYHSITVGIKKRSVRIWKFHWDSIYLDRIEETQNDRKKADVAVILINKGEAHIYLMAEHITLHVSSIRTYIPKKANIKIHKSKLETFFTKVARQTMTLDYKVVKGVIVASPGFVNQQLISHFMQLSRVKPALYGDLEKYKHVFLPAHVSSAHPSSLLEVVSSEEVVSKLADTKAFVETKVLQEFYKTLKDKENQAIYGPNHCKVAVEMGAVDKLLISDLLFRSSNSHDRKKWVEVTKQVESFNGQVFIFSSMHQTGKSLNDHGGIAAILRFDLDEAVFNPKSHSISKEKPKMIRIEDDIDSGFSSDEDDSAYFYSISTGVSPYCTAAIS